jgi:hypothetical protein
VSGPTPEQDEAALCALAAKAASGEGLTCAEWGEAEAIAGRILERALPEWGAELARDAEAFLASLQDPPAS